ADASPQAAPAAPEQPEPSRAMERRDGAAREKPLASPAVRQHARQLDIDLTQVTGSGPGGRILREDLDAFKSRARPEDEAPAVASGTGGDGASDAGATAVETVRDAADTRPSWETQDEDADEEAIPLFGLRRRIARTMQQALRIPHFTYVEEVDVTE